MDYTLGGCKNEELAELGELCNQVFRTRRDGDMMREYPLLFDPANVDQLRVARSGGRIVAHVGLCLREVEILGARLLSASVGSVATLPEARGKGIASRLMEDATRHAVERGASLMLISGTRGLYRRLGYVEVGCFQAHSHRSAPRDASAGMQSMMEWTRAGTDDIETLKDLYDSEPVRFHRSADDWQRLLGAGMLMNQTAEVWLLRVAGARAAYAAVQWPMGPGAGENAPLVVMEVAGYRPAITATLPFLSRQYGAEAAVWVAGLHDAAPGALHLDPSDRTEALPFPGTLAMIDEGRFLDCIAPLVERSGTKVRMAAESDGVSITLGTQRQHLSRSEFTALVFGGETEDARAVPELEPELRAQLQLVFPLPLPWPGFNYV